MAVMRASMERARVRRLISKSVSLTHLHVLTVLRAEGSLHMGELATALDISVASATGIVSRMEERGLVARARDERDRRAVTVDLAEGGRAALEQIQGRGREHFRSLLDRLDDDELELVRGGFGALHRAHEELGAEAERQAGEQTIETRNA